MMGFAYGVGSLAIVAVGAGADRIGIAATLEWVIAVPIIAGLLGAWLPAKEISARQGPSPSASVGERESIAIRQLSNPKTKS